MQTPEVKKVIAGGAAIGEKFAKVCFQNYVEQARTGLSADNCPSMVTFNLAQLRAYLQEVEKEFEQKGIAPEDAAIAVAPMIYPGEKTFNLMFVPCNKEGQPTIESRIIWNHGSGWDLDEFGEWLSE
jgi:hypothetical protein